MVAVPGHFRQAKPLVERLRAAVDREHVENQVLPLGSMFASAISSCKNACILRFHEGVLPCRYPLTRATAKAMVAAR